MKIFFSPEYSGNVYIQSGGKNVMMDSVVVNTMGLIAMLELRLGLHYEDTPEQERVAHYYESVCQYNMWMLLIVKLLSFKRYNYPFYKCRENEQQM